ncbi:MAG: T9SS type A sorting domain-containing protein [Bacteroidota bacterium]
MRVISTLIVFVFYSGLAAQNVLPEVVLVSDGKKKQTIESITGQIQKASSTDLSFPITSRGKNLLVPFIPCCLCLPPKTKVEVKPVKTQLRCAATKQSQLRPFWIVVGQIMDEKKIMDSLRPEHIESIVILKESDFNFTCRRPYFGVIVITTKKLTERRLVVKDFHDNNPIPKATVSFVFPERKDTLRYIADDSGVVVSNSLPKLEGCEIIVSAVGYKTEASLFSFKKQKPLSEIFLKRDVKNYPEVIITCFDCIRTIRCGGYRIKVTRGTEEKTSIIENNKLILYPNPVARGGLINIEYPVTEDKLLLSVASIDGKSILARPYNSAAGREQLQTGLWPGGTYIIRLLYANGRPAASQKLVIQ